MWLCTKHGFASIVRKTPNSFQVRFRDRADADEIAELIGKTDEIITTPQGDYGWRLILDQSTLFELFAALAMSVDYPNFKAQVAHSNQARKLATYQGFWADMLLHQRIGR